MARAKAKTTPKRSSKVVKAEVLPPTTTKFADLPKNLQHRIHARMVTQLRRLGFFTGGGVMTAQGRGGYTAVWSNTQLNRKWVTAETEGETGQLTASERNRLISFARQTARVSEKFESILAAVSRGTIGTEGGKCIITMPNEYAAAQKKIQQAFANWADECEFFDSQSLNDLLKLVLRALMTSGDLVLVFDDNVLRDNTGKVITFEGDTIGNLAEGDFAAAFGKRGYTQHQGIIKSANGQTIGVICSWSQRGQTEYKLFDGDGRRAAWTLIKPADTKWVDSRFTIIRNFARPNQMRGYSPLWSGLTTISDGADLQNFEIQAAKKNAQTLMTIEQEDSEVGEGELAAELDPDAITPLAVDGNEDTPIQEEFTQQRLDLDAIASSGALYDVLPPSCKATLLDTPRPNMNVAAMADFLVRSASWAAGLSSLYATGKSDASYSASMSEMLISSQAFQIEYKRLEREVLDWVFSNWSRRAQSRGEIPQDFELPDNWRKECVQWASGVKVHALNPIDSANATSIELKNMTTSYRDLLGPAWKEKLAEIADEVKYCQQLGIPDPRLQTVSGGVINTSTSTTNEENK